MLCFIVYISVKAGTQSCFYFYFREAYYYAVIDAFVGRTYQRRPKAAQAGDMDSNTI
jgi:hypothetical protein